MLHLHILPLRLIVKRIAKTSKYMEDIRLFVVVEYGFYFIE